jgi:hypothetical protein
MTHFAFINVRKNAGTSVSYLLGMSLINYTIVDSPKKVRDFVSFAVARNPYTRCVSSWKFCETTCNRPLLDCLANPPVKGHNGRRNDDYTHFTKKQSEFIFEDGIGVNHILRFENLEEDLRNMFSLYNVSIPPLPKLNKGSYDYTLSDEEREAIYEFYKEDFINLGYEK